jgi:PadR family transcriptional regulator PadR
MGGGFMGVSENNRRAKYYALTTSGHQALRSATDDWVCYADAVFKVLGSDQGG